MYDYEDEKADISMNETDLLNGLLEAANYKDNSENFIKLQIKRNGKQFFEFKIRPLSEDEIMECYKKATKYVSSRQNGVMVKTATETDVARYRSLKIYTATVTEDRIKLWDNKNIQDKLNVLTGADMIDAVLLVGEKDSIGDKIDEISGYNGDLIEFAKN